MHEVGDRHEVREVQFVDDPIFMIAVPQEDLSRRVVEAASLSLGGDQRSEAVHVLECRDTRAKDSFRRAA